MRSSGGRGIRSPFLALLPLRFFFGVTFLYAGLDKLLDPTFLHETGRGSIGAQMTAWVDISPIGGLVQTFLPYAVPVGIAIAFAEICIGIGAVIGLAYRLSAFGGMLLSLLFFLTASWAVHPYYLGNDLPYAVGWATLALVGSGGLLTVDAWLSGRASAARVGGPADGLVRQRRLILRAGVLAVLGLCVAGLATVASVALGKHTEGPGRQPIAEPDGGGLAIAYTACVALGVRTTLTGGERFGVTVGRPVRLASTDGISVAIAFGATRREAARAHGRRHRLASGRLPGPLHERSRHPAEAAGRNVCRVRRGVHPCGVHRGVRSDLGLSRLPVPRRHVRPGTRREGDRRADLHPVDGVSDRGRPGCRHDSPGRRVTGVARRTAREQPTSNLRKGNGAGDGIRTRDIQLGRLALHQLSYSRS